MTEPSSFRGAAQRRARNPEPLDSGPRAGARGRNDIVISGISLHADPAGALYWPEQGLLAVADLHLEKGSSFAARGQLLPPYDTAETRGSSSDP